MTTITRRFTFHSAHRLLNHEGKCKHLHGHSYSAFVTCTAAELNDQGMVIDFSAIKELIGGWIDREWDHNAILHPEDLLIQDLTAEGSRAPSRLYLDHKPLNPTAENLAKFLYYTSKDLLRGMLGITVTEVMVQETENCQAVYKGEN